MKSICMQFHATSDELFEFVWKVASELGLNIVVTSVRPFKLKKITSLDGMRTASEKTDSNKDLSIHLLNKKPVCSVKNNGDFLDLNEDCVTLDFGELGDLGLGESILSFRSEDEKSIEVAKNIVSSFKKISKAGVVGINSVTKAEAFYRSHRYTEGAKNLHDAGVNLLSLGSNVYLKIPS